MSTRALDSREDEQVGWDRVRSEKHRVVSMSMPPVVGIGDGSD